jgi:hypothetical protein
MVKKTCLFCMLALLALPLWSDEIAPPGWIIGQWAMEFEGDVIVVTFLEDDIFVDGVSMAQMIAEGYVLRYSQQITETDYSIRIEYADGFWWEESFPIPSMTSVYTDDSYEEGQYETLTYKFIPWKTGPIPSPVPGDFN